MATFDTLKNVHDDYVILLANANNDKISFVSGVASKLTDKYQAGNIVKRAASLTNGSGGGRKEMAQGGGKDISKLDECLKVITEELK